VTHANLRLLVGVVLAVLVPAAAMELAVGDDRLAAELTAAPFAWRRVLLAHLAAAVPLGLAVAACVHSRPGLAAAPRWAWAMVGLVLAGVVALVSPQIGSAVAGADLGMMPLLVLRSLLAGALVIPWCVAAGRTPSTDHRHGLALAIGAGLAVVPCGLYVDAVAAARTHEAGDLIAQKRLAPAEGVVVGLCEVGSDRPIGTMSPAKVRAWLAGYLSAMRREADRPLSASATAQERIDRAILLVEVERLDDAADVLQPLAPADDTATLMLAAIHRDRRRWAEAEALYTTVLNKSLPRAGADAAARAASRTAFEGLAESAHGAGRPADAEAILTRGLHELPADAPRFHHLLGRHYFEVGRIGLAREHLEAAARLDPVGSGQSAEELIRQIRTATPGCLAGSR
jgi:hypothetical protein